ncbi:MAG TPA: hotdog fold domain-containing protein [Bryobacteraceae bacterium]|nr:hotdog fold domain-containing protein [Bryobacteraceae bacterium]
MSRSLPPYRVRAVNTAPESENKIHDDSVAAGYGFRGGLVPGVTVYGYMTVPIVASAPEWLERGTMKVRFLEPVYDGDELMVKATVDGASINVTAAREDGTVCAIGTGDIPATVAPPVDRYPQHPLPAGRPAPSVDNLVPGAALGTVLETIEVAEPRAVLQFSNEILVRNFKLGPWIHTGSEIQNYSAVRSGDLISARGRIHDRYERKGHKFVVVDVMLIANGDRLAQAVRHTAIYQPRPKS